MLENPFEHLRTPSACLHAMSLHDANAGPMLRCVGVHALQRTLRAALKRPIMEAQDGDLVRMWLLPLAPSAAQPPASQRSAPDMQHEQSSPRDHVDRVAAIQSEPGGPGTTGGVHVLRERASVLLLYALAKLVQTRRGWEALVTHSDVQRLITALLERVAHLTPHLDAQVRH